MQSPTLFKENRQDGKDVLAEIAGDLGLDVMEAEEFAAWIKAHSRSR